MTNFVGILSQGLRIAPPEAPVTGYMFGESCNGFSVLVFFFSQSFFFTCRQGRSVHQFVCLTHSLTPSSSVYFADRVSKSANYCHAHISNGEGVMLLCEVALVCLSLHAFFFLIYLCSTISHSYHNRVTCTSSSALIPV